MWTSDAKDQVFVSGIWTKTRPKEERELAYRELRRTLRILKGCNLLIYYDEIESLDFIRSEAFELDIKLVTVPLHMGELPGIKYIDSFIKRTLSYGLSQHPDNQAHDLLDKAWNLYWLGYIRWGEEYFRHWLTIKLSKFELVGHFAPEISNFTHERFTWLDHDFHRWRTDRKDLALLLHENAQDSITHFEGHFTYLGHELSVSSYAMSANKDVWQDMIKPYAQQIERLGHFPYAYDEEVALGLLEAQLPLRFSRFGSRTMQNSLLKSGSM